MSGRKPGSPKTGGRQAGTPNKRTLDVIAKLEALGCDPIEGMARIAMDQSNSPELRGKCSPNSPATSHRSGRRSTTICLIPRPLHWAWWLSQPRLLIADS